MSIPLSILFNLLSIVVITVSIKPIYYALRLILIFVFFKIKGIVEAGRIRSSDTFAFTRVGNPIYSEEIAFRDKDGKEVIFLSAAPSYSEPAVGTAVQVLYLPADSSRAILFDRSKYVAKPIKTILFYLFLIFLGYSSNEVIKNSFRANHVSSDTNSSISTAKDAVKSISSTLTQIGSSIETTFNNEKVERKIEKSLTPVLDKFMSTPMEELIKREPTAADLEAQEVAERNRMLPPLEKKKSGSRMLPPMPQ